MAFFRKRLGSGNEGQILLIVVVSMIVALTVGLAVAARIVTELKISKQNEESQRAFQAAESGIQQTLLNSQTNNTVNIQVPLGNNASFTAEKKALSGSAIIVNNGQEVDQTVGADVWLSDYSTDPNLIYKKPMGLGSSVPITMYWGSSNQTACPQGSGDNTAPAIEVILLQGTIATPTFVKAIFESSPCVRINNAVPGRITPNPKYTLNGKTFMYDAPLKFGNSGYDLGTSIINGLIMRVIPIFNSTIVAFSVGTGSPFVFPPQGSVVTSTGTSGDTVRKVEYYSSYPQLPLEIFPYSIISQ